MRKRRFLVALMCMVSVTLFASCTAKGSSTSGNQQKTEDTPASVGKIAKDVVAPFFESDESETALEGYVINSDIVEKVQQVYGLVGFGRVKDSKIQRALSFSGEGEFADETDSFLFEFVPKDDGAYQHDIFLGYAKAIYDMCLKAADDGKIYNGFWNDSKQISFDESLKVYDKKADKRKCTIYYMNQGQKRRVHIAERGTKEGGFGRLSVDLERVK